MVNNLTLMRIRIRSDISINKHREELKNSSVVSGFLAAEQWADMETCPIATQKDPQVAQKSCGSFIIGVSILSHTLSISCLVESGRAESSSSYMC